MKKLFKIIFAISIMYNSAIADIINTGLAESYGHRDYYTSCKSIGGSTNNLSFVIYTALYSGNREEHLFFLEGKYNNTFFASDAVWSPSIYIKDNSNNIDIGMDNSLKSELSEIDRFSSIKTINGLINGQMTLRLLYNGDGIIGFQPNIMSNDVQKLTIPLTKIRCNKL